MAKLFGGELFYTHEPHLADKEVFDFPKHKADILLGFKGESHRPVS
jgi:hypothetical protein